MGFEVHTPRMRALRGSRGVKMDRNANIYIEDDDVVCRVAPA